MISKSLWRIVFVGGGNAINAGLGFLFLTAAARTLSLEDFGKYSLLMSILISLARLMDFGTNSIFVTRYISDKKSGLNDTFVTLRIFLLIATLPIFIGLAWYFKILDLPILMIFLGGLVGYFFNFTFHAYFQKDERFFELVLLNTLPSIIKGAAAVIILLGFSFINLHIAFAIFSLSMLTNIFLAPFLPKDIKSYKFNMDEIGQFFKKAAPAGISQLLAESWPTLNNSIAKILKSFSDVGIFSLANKLASTFTIVSFSIFTVLLPKNAALKKEKKGYDYKETLFLSAGVLMLTGVAALMAKYVVPLIFGEKFLESVGLLNVLIFASALTAIHTFIENFFFIENQTGTIFYINVTKLAVFLAGSLLLAGTFGLMGLAYANLISALVAVLITLGLTYRYRFISRSSLS